MTDNLMNSDELESALSELDMLGMEDDLAEEQPVSNDTGLNMEMFQNVPLTITLEVASAEITMGELSKVQGGDVLPLDKAVNEPLDVKVNGVLFAKAEVVMVDGKYGLKFCSGHS